MADMITSGAPLAHFKTAGQVEISSLKVTFGPTQSGTGNPSPSNIRTISGVSSITVQQCGKNVYDDVAYPMYSYYINGNTGADGESTKSNACNRDFMDCSMFAGQTLTLNVRPTGKTPGIAFYTSAEQASYSSGIINNNVTTPTHWTFTVPQDAKYMRFTTNVDNAETAQLEVGQSTTTYETYIGQQYSINLPDTFYGGYVDLVSGTLTVTMGIVDLGTLGWAATSTDHMFKTYIPDGAVPSLTQQGTGVGWCEAYKVVKKSYADFNDCEMCCNNWSIGSQYYGIVILDSNYSDSQVFKASLNGVHFVYELNTPVTYQLTPQTIKTLRGVNNIWSNKGTVEVTCPLTETMDIIMAKKRIMNASLRVLPPAYQRVEYLDTADKGTQHIDTGIAGNDDTLAFEMKFYYSDHINYQGVFGNYVNEQTNCWRAIQRADTKGFYVTGNHIASSSPSLLPRSGSDHGCWMILRIDGASASLTDDQGTYTADNVGAQPYGTTNNNNIAYGRNNVLTTWKNGTYLNNKLGYFRAWRNGILIRDYIPCYRKSDSKTGFYDLVNNIFTTSCTIHDFIAGPNV